MLQPVSEFQGVFQQTDKLFLNIISMEGKWYFDIFILLCMGGFCPCFDFEYICQICKIWYYILSSNSLLKWKFIWCKLILF